MADYALVSAATVSAPKEYALPAATPQVALHAVTASFDGTSAVGAYLPALQMLAPDGTVMWTAIATNAVSAGVSVDVSWFRGIGGSTVNAQAGTILQTYTGLCPATDFTWTTNNVNQDPGFPTNNVINKISNTSLLLIHFEGDFNSGPNAPDVVAAKLSVDGLDTQSVFHQVSFGGGRILSVDLSRYLGTGGASNPVLAAGAHSVHVYVWNLVNQGGTGVTALTAATGANRPAWNMEIIEIEV